MHRQHGNLSFKVFTIEDGSKIIFTINCDNFYRRNFGTGVSSRCPVQKEPKHLLLQLGMMVAELGNSSIHRSVKTSTSEQTSFSTRMSKRAVKDPKICEVLVDKVKSRDLGDWR